MGDGRMGNGDVSLVPALPPDTPRVARNPAPVLWPGGPDEPAVGSADYFARLKLVPFWLHSLGEPVPPSAATAAQKAIGTGGNGLQAKLELAESYVSAMSG